MQPEALERLRGRLRSLLHAERVTRVLCWRSGPVPGYRWRAPSSSWRDQTRLTSHRDPPLPFHSFTHSGAGTCRVCGQPIYGAGDYRSFAGARSTRLTWHSICVTSYLLMKKPGDFTELLILKQRNVCPLSGDRIDLPYPRGIDVDHVLPLYRVGRDHRDEPWYELIRFWGSGNLAAITRAAHLAKCAAEARERSNSPGLIPEQVAML